MRVAFQLAFLFALPQLCVGQNQDSTICFPLFVEAKHHQAIGDLASESLFVTKNKAAVTNLRVSRAVDSPLELGVLIDTSMSEATYNPRGFVAAAKSFAQDMLRNSSDRAFFMRFDLGAAATPWLTRDQVATLPEKVGTSGATALHDAVVSASEVYGSPQECNRPVRRILILISDGNDNSSHVTREEAITKAVSSGAVVFSLGTSLVSTGPLRGDRTMEDFAERTGGKYYSDVQAKDAVKTFTDISRRLSDMYFVSYSSSSKDTRRGLLVRLKTPGKFGILYPPKLTLAP